MTDKELLTLAAKAASIPLDVFGDTENGDYWIDAEGTYWNPLTDDADALRLAVNLKLPIFYSRITDIGIPVVSCHKIYEDVHEEDRWQWIELEADPYAATRRAIVRASAEIGKGMEHA